MEALVKHLEALHKAILEPNDEEDTKAGKAALIEVVGMFLADVHSIAVSLDSIAHNIASISDRRP